MNLFREVPEQLSCTSVPQQWHVPRGNTIAPTPINHVVVARATEGIRSRKPVLCQLDVQTKLVIKCCQIYSKSYSVYCCIQHFYWIISIWYHSYQIIKMIHVFLMRKVTINRSQYIICSDIYCILIVLTS